MRDVSLKIGNMLHIPPGNKRDARDTAAGRDAVFESGIGGTNRSDFLVKCYRYRATDKRIKDRC